MKKTIAILLVLCLCIGLYACGGNSNPTEPTKSAEAKKADELILAIGEVTVDSEAGILAAQAYYDTLTEKQKAEVEHYDVLVSAQEILPQKKIEEQHNLALELIKQGDYMQASSIVYAHPEFSDYDELVKECGKGIISQYIKSRGTKESSGIYRLELANDGTATIELSYYEAGDLITFFRSMSYYGIYDGLSVSFVPGSGELSFSRDTSNLTLKTYHQEGTVNLNEYTGTLYGTIVENSSEPFGVYGLTTTSYKTIYDTLGKGYQQGTMLYINECLDATFAAVVEAGYTGTMNDMGFAAYKSE